MTAEAWWREFDDYATASGFLPLDGTQAGIIMRARRAGLSPSAAIVALQQLELETNA